MKYFLSLLIGLFLLPYQASAQAITQDADGYRSVIERVFTVQPGGRLVLRTSGDISVSSWSQSTVEVRETVRMRVHTSREAEEIMQRTANGYRIQGNTVTIDTERGGGSIRRAYEIKVPERFGLEANTEGGNIALRNLGGTVAARTSGGNISVDQITGSTQISTSGGNLSIRAIDGTLEASTSGGNIAAQDLRSTAKLSTSGGNIALSNASQDVSVATSGGNISIRQVAGRVTASTSGGDVSASDCTGEVVLSTSGGHVSLNAMGGPVRAQTSGGHISGNDFAGPLDVKTSGGHIQLRNARSGVTASTSAGNLDVEITRHDLPRQQAIDLRTSAGNIALQLPSRISASVDAGVQLSGDRFGGRFDILSDFPLTKTIVDERLLHSTGDLNGGGSRIYLRTSNGNIEIKASR